MPKKRHSLHTDGSFPAVHSPKEQTDFAFDEEGRPYHITGTGVRKVRADRGRKRGPNRRTASAAAEMIKQNAKIVEQNAFVDKLEEKEEENAFFLELYRQEHGDKKLSYNAFRRFVIRWKRKFKYIPPERVCPICKEQRPKLSQWYVNTNVCARLKKRAVCKSCCRRIEALLSHHLNKINSQGLSG